MGPSTKGPWCLNLNAGTNKGSTVGVNVLQNFGEHMLRIFFLGGRGCSVRNQVGGPRATARLAHANDHHCVMIF